jgi:hypothetical protein
MWLRINNKATKEQRKAFKTWLLYFFVVHELLAFTPIQRWRPGLQHGAG